MNPWKRVRAPRRPADQQAAEPAPRPDHDGARPARQAVSPERFDRPLLQFLDPA